MTALQQTNKYQSAWIVSEAQATPENLLIFGEQLDEAGFGTLSDGRITLSGTGLSPGQA